MNQQKDVENWCKKCLVCSVNKRPPKDQEEKWGNVGAPFERIAIVGPSLIIGQGNRLFISGYGLLQ